MRFSRRNNNKNNEHHNSGSYSYDQQNQHHHNMLTSQQQQQQQQQHHQDHIRTTPTESESFDDDDESDTYSGSQDSEGLGVPIPTGYLLGTNTSSTNTRQNNSPNTNNKSKSNKRSSPNQQNMAPAINDEDRLLMLAKHPNATEEQVVQTLFRQQQVKAMKLQQQQMQQQRQHPPMQKQQQQHNVSFASVFPVDSDTGEAWDRQRRATANRGNPSNTNFDQVWASEEDPEHAPPQHSSSTKPSLLLGLWRRIIPLPADSAMSTSSDHTATNNSRSKMAMDNASLSISMTSDKTPKISNVDEKARSKRIRNDMGYYSCGDRCGSYCHHLFKTKIGLVVLALLIVLILAVVVTVVSAFLSQSSSNEKATQANTADSNDLDFPWEDNRLSLKDPPTDTPLAVPVIPAAPTVQATGAPTQAPTSSPTRRPTTMSPTVPDATRSPTFRPTTSTPTSMPTRAPTLRPTPRPMTAAPSKLPTTAAPTAAMTSDFVTGPGLLGVGPPLDGMESEQRFGQTVALSTGGQVLAVGAPLATVGSKQQAGWAQVFEYSDAANDWTARGFPLAGRNDEDQFGSALALSADGSILVVSEPNFAGTAGDRSGNVRTFVYSGTSYLALTQELQGSEATDHFGMSVALSANGRRMAVGAPYHDNGGPNRNVSGQVTVYDFVDGESGSPGQWKLTVTLAGIAHLDWFGWKVDLTEDGSVLCVGAPRNLESGGYVHCYSEDGVDSWALMGSMIRNKIAPVRYDDNFGHALKVSRSSSDSGIVRVAVGAPGKNDNALDAGLVAVYEYKTNDSSVWRQLGNPIRSETPGEGHELGFAVDLQGDILVVGTPGMAQVDRYRYSSGNRTWEHHATPLKGATGSSFGYAIHQRGDRVAVGSAETPGDNTGRVHVYQSSQ